MIVIVFGIITIIICNMRIIIIIYFTFLIIAVRIILIHSQITNHLYITHS